MVAECISSGSEVFGMLTKRNFDLALMDTYFGAQDSRRLAREIKSDSRYNHITILLYSAKTISQDSIEQSLANDFIRKPFEMPVLINRIREMAGM